ncbi:hypothetical protein [Neisseria montereyensis]|uniref:Uracil-DNA glycosylase-like domain-containing protein n=1 Tax=Neisseria montereyensis TaxID=2973938 RepID=A0ABT2FC26_9NEIS|nr:hypothetical protein [Neisseria montereyensis]MCS4533115.1 hypothetical protein [Neisseria montereyensis]
MNNKARNLEHRVGHSIFPGFNDKQGLMICGYEWGESKSDEKHNIENPDYKIDYSIECTFSNKRLRYGQDADSWPYDRAIKKWFKHWGHPLDNENSPLEQDFQKSILQTNWLDEQNNNMDGRHTKQELIDNQEDFLDLIRQYEPLLIIFVGSKLIQVLNNKAVLPQFEALMGARQSAYTEKSFGYRKPKFRFQSFQKCQVVCCPHPAYRGGISDEYIDFFKPDMNQLIIEYKKSRGFKL